MKNFRRNNSGITLIALVITIVVLLILAGVTIATLTGENGILTRANSAKEETEEAEDIEKIRLAVSEAQIGDNRYQELTTDNLGSALIKDGTKALVSDNEDGTKHILFLDEKKEYKLDNNGNIADLNIDFDTKYVAPSSQDESRNEGVIGIGTDGKPVDMDLWEYTELENGTYGLNTKDGLDSSGNSGRYSGYKGGYTDDGRIIGNVPTYISLDNGNNFTSVTSLVHTFYNCTELRVAPNIPYTVTDMRVTFYMCTNLEIASDIPAYVTSMGFAFSNCTKLVSMPNIGENVVEFTGAFQNCINLMNTTKLPDNILFMSASFLGCSSLTVAPEIPKQVENMQSTFQDCHSLQSPPSLIPSSVKNLSYTFYNCKNLSGAITINAEPETFDNCFFNATTVDGTELRLTGSCSILHELREQGGNII